ncbi:septum formation protein Maf [Microgenomates group bacterium RIFCSPLOWO2_01_FULL_46_13]|nr:MAG: septum formation protein Maf [Microgenomates group bacterium RIFCSPHIGHO2_01_FULL_45_11]OGV95051.1 MAG: septum formation protein Maf [Microgenomates group bacterium RIFCSPLOWO2_01_FULL_46_13]
MHLVLASGSIWRKELLSWLNLPFQVIVSDFDETSITSNDPEELVASLAVAKAQVVTEAIRHQSHPETKRLHPELEGKHYEPTLVIGADTVIVVSREDGSLQILGKPKDEQEARFMLTALRAKTHQVYTGVAIVNVETGEKVVEVDRSLVTFGNFSDQELSLYLQTKEYVDKAGSYQILGHARRFLDNLEGSLTGVVGLPLQKTANLLETMGLIIPVNVREVVLAKTGFPD